MTRTFSITDTLLDSSFETLYIKFWKEETKLSLFSYNKLSRKPKKVKSKAPNTKKKGKHIKSTVFQVPAIANMKPYWKKWKFTMTKNYNDKTKDAKE